MNTTHNKILQALINAGIKVKGVSETEDGIFITLSDAGSKYRVFCAKETPMPVKLVKEAELYNIEY
jgi:hypothetical protein